MARRSDPDLEFAAEHYSDLVFLKDIDKEFLSKDERWDLHWVLIKYTEVAALLYSSEQKAKNQLEKQINFTREKESNILKTKEHKEKRNDLSQIVKVDKLKRTKIIREIRCLIDKKKKMYAQLPYRDRVDLKSLHKKLKGYNKMLEVTKLPKEDRKFSEKQVKEAKLKIREIESKGGLSNELKETNKEIDALSSKADSQHRLVVQFAEESQKHHEQILILQKKNKHLKYKINGCKEKHEKYSDEIHDHKHTAGIVCKELKRLTNLSIFRKDDQTPQRLDQKMESALDVLESGDSVEVGSGFPRPGRKGRHRKK